MEVEIAKILKNCENDKNKKLSDIYYQLEKKDSETLSQYLRRIIKYYDNIHENIDICKYKNKNIPNQYSVSVVINTYKEKGDILIRAINSYLFQYNVNVHLIISTIEDDNSIELIKEIYKDNYDIDLSILSKEEISNDKYQNIYKQLNKATSFIKNKWYCYASGNDIAYYKKIYDEINKCLQNNKQVCYSSFYLVNGNLNDIGIQKFNQYDYQEHIKRNFVTDCALIDSNILKSVLPFSLKYNNHAYWDLFLRIYEKYGNIFIYNENPEFFYISHKNSLHLNRKKEDDEKLRKIKEEMQREHLEMVKKYL